MNTPEALKTIKEAITSHAVVEVPTKPEVPPVSDPSLAAYGIGGIATGVVAGILWLHKHFSKSSLGWTQDRAEGQLLQSVMKERDAAVKRADDALAKSVVDAGRMASLEERNRYLQEEVQRLNALVEKMEKQFDELKKSLKSLSDESRKPLPLTPPPTPGVIDNPNSF